MKTTIVITLVLFFVSPWQETREIAGLWKMSDNGTEIEIEKEGDAYQGTVVKSEAAKAMGKVVLQDFKKEGDLWKGKFYAARRDRLVDATLKETDGNTLQLEVQAGRKSRKLNLTRAK